MKAITTALLFILFFLSINISCSKQGIDKHCGKIAAIGTALYHSTYYDQDDDISSYDNELLLTLYYGTYTDCLKHSPGRIGGYD